MAESVQCQRDGQVGAPPKHNAPQRWNPREPPEEIAKEAAPLTQEHIPRITQGFVQLLSYKNFWGKLTPRDRIAMTTHFTGNLT